MTSSPHSRRAPAWPIIIIIIAGLGLRLVWLNAPLYRTHHWNEGHYACTVLNFARYGYLEQHNDLGLDRSFSPFVPLLLTPGARLSHGQPWGFRLPLALLGAGALFAFYRLMTRRWGLPWPVALAALCVGASAPGIVYYARNIQLDGTATALLLAALWLVSAKRRRVQWLGWAAWACCVLAKTSFAAAAPAVLLARVAARPGDWRGWRAWVRAAVPLTLGLAPIAAWQALGGVKDPGASNEFLFRLKEWSVDSVAKAIAETPGFFLRDFGWAGLALAALGLCYLLFKVKLRLRRCATPLAFGLFWTVFIFSHPTAYWANRYYIYPGLYLLALLAGWGIWGLTGLLTAKEKPLALAVLCMGLILINGNLLQENYGRIRLKGPASRTQRAGGDPFSPFQDFKLPSTAKPLLVDYPSTMFYAGGDPARVQCAYGDVALRFDPARYGAVALNLFEYDGKTERQLLDRLNSLGWREVAPRIWAAR